MWATKTERVRVSDLAPYPVITYLPQALLRPYIDRALSERKPALDIAVQTGTSATAIMLAVHGAGIALVETALFAARPIPGFVARPIEPKVQLKILLLRPRQAAGSRALEDFLAHLRTVFP
jgi:DNA-binding transcriptional LysR family regulator